MLVNDVHSRLNETNVDQVATPKTVDELIAAVQHAKQSRRSVCVSGSRHAMGGQQFAEDGVLIDMRHLNRVLSFDRMRGLIDVEAGIQWPDLLKYLYENQAHDQDDGQNYNAEAWAFRQKQTGADDLTMGGCLAVNIHGRGLAMKPFIDDVESFTLLTPGLEVLTVSRTQNASLFGLVIGGYGLFGIVVSVKLRLSHRRIVKRHVVIAQLSEVPKLFAARKAEGYLYGDFQYSIDTGSDTYLNQGVFACYQTLPQQNLPPETQKELGEKDWVDLLTLAHVKPDEAYKKYAAYYLSTQGQLYESDKHQMSIYPLDYHLAVDPHMGHVGTEMITEVYVPLEKLPTFFNQVKADFLRDNTQVVYGTVRLIDKDTESFLAWAKADFACIIFNLHIEHSVTAIAAAQLAFNGLIDRALALGGSYYLTYHRWARKDQVLAAYPQIPAFLAQKLSHDPDELFQSNWYRHYKKMFA
jgi:FAD/FMN-containing dehydrogenase